MAEARNDKDGWKRGVGHYSGNYAKLDRVEDRKEVKHRIVREDDPSLDKPGPVSRGGPPRFKPKSGPPTNGAN